MAVIRLYKENIMSKKFYAIKEGFDSENNKKVEDKVVDTWGECLKYVKGVKGAKYKSFQSMKDASVYLNKGSKMLKKGVDNYPEDCLHIYVDGSYNEESEKYSYGIIAVRNDVVEYIESGAAKDNSKKNIRQIAGELKAAVRALEYALENGEEKVVIFHDYEGVSHHATGFWERREESSIEYYIKMNELMSSGIEVIFVKVDSHTGDIFNELADEKCKEKLSIASDNVVKKWLCTHTLTVLNQHVKDEILNIAPDSSDKIFLTENYENKGYDEKDFMFEAIVEAKKSMENLEVPVGAVIVKDGNIIARAHNLKERLKDSTAHAEIIVIRKASEYLNNWRLTDCSMYVTLEPCPMCAGAILQSRINKLYIGTFDQESGACGSVINILQNDNLNHWTDIKWCHDERCSDILKSFFKSKRYRACK